MPRHSEPTGTHAGQLALRCGVQRGGQRSRGVDVYDVGPERKLYRTQQHTTRRNPPDARPGYGWQRVAYGPGSAVRRGNHGPRGVYAPGRPLLLCAASAALQRWAVLLAIGFETGQR